VVDPDAMTTSASTKYPRNDGRPRDLWHTACSDLDPDARSGRRSTGFSFSNESASFRVASSTAVDLDKKMAIFLGVFRILQARPDV
jgi:hypothetical protein